MICGVIDIGSQSCRLKIAGYDGGHWSTLQDELYASRLMKGVAETGCLAESSMASVMQALRQFQERMDSFQVQRFRIVATSAMREAENAPAFREKIAREMGLDVEVISGEEEAALGYAGMKAGFPRLEFPLMLDVGGGSSEFYAPGKIQLSLKMGAVRAAEEQLDQEAARKILEDLHPFVSQIASCPLVGCGGTITSLAAVFYKMEQYDREKVQGTKLSRGCIESIWRDLKGLAPQELRHVPGLQPQRADIIVPGIFWVLQIMDFLHAEELYVSDADLREGILQQFI